MREEAAEFIMGIDLESPEYREDREQNIDDLEEELVTGNLDRRRLCGVVVDGHILMLKTQVLLESLQKTIVILGYAFVLFGGFLAVQTVQLEQRALWIALYAGLAFAIGANTLWHTPNKFVIEWPYRGLVNAVDRLYSLAPGR